MLFNSYEFLLFLPTVFILYWFVFKTLKNQNRLLLLASYFFYGWWDYRFLFLLMFSTLLDYYTGLKMSEATAVHKRKFWFWLSIIVNLGFLGIFKYYNFFAHSFAEGMERLGIHISPWTLQVILPVGISFYTFHGLSYVIDIYKKRIEAERNFIDYAVFVSFFPLLVAGPIERATHLLPQIKKPRQFDYSHAVDGLKQILWGLFKKIAIADTCATYVNIIFAPGAEVSGSTHILGAFFFAIQIYCDFSGYSDIAIGTAKLFGIDLLRNFAYPYFSRDIAEFWRRWHISLSSWFKDYLYIPLGGSKVGNWRKCLNTLIIFVVSGFWHGANWTFIVWGLLNAIYIMPLIWLQKNRMNLDIVAKGKALPSFKELLSMIVTFGLAVFAWIFFRAENLDHAFGFIAKIFTASTFTMPYFPGIGLSYPVFIFILFLLLMEWRGRENRHALEQFGIKWKTFFRWSFYSVLILITFYFSYASANKDFIYFQF